MEEDNSYQQTMMAALGMGQPGGLPMPRFITEDQVLAEARPMAQRIFKNWEILKVITERREETIQKRWVKKSRPKRRALLLEAWPNMPQSHRPDIAAWKREGKQSNWTRDRDATPFMWPHINLEDLSKTEPLLLMLNSRARYAPDYFATADLAPTRFGFVSQMITSAFLNGYVMMFRGRKTPETYGQLYSWDDHEDASEWLSSERGNHPGEGLWILEIQDRLYDFLVNCCRQILHDIPAKSLADSSLPVLPEPPLVTAKTSSEGIESLAIASFEAPYKVPADLDLDRLEAVVEAKLADAEDHIWSLREDPGYFAKALNEGKEHRLESLPDKRGQPHPVFSRSKTDLLWERIVAETINNALDEADLWNAIYEKVVDLRQLARKHANSFTPDDDLPSDLAMAFYKLYIHLDRYQEAILSESNLLKGFCASPPMRSHYVREVPFPDEYDKMTAVSRNIPQTDAEGALIWIFATLSDQRQRFLMGRKALLTEIELLFRQDSSAKRLVSGWISDKIATFAVICEAFHQIELYQPWAAGFQYNIASRMDTLNKDFFQVSTKYTGMRHREVKNMWPKVASRGNPTDGRFNYPVDKSRTRENVEAMRQAEANLDGFWALLLGSLRKAGAMSPRMEGIFKRDLQRTGPWVEPTKLPKKEDIVAVSKDILSFRLDDREKVKVDAPVEKIKKKTRGQANPALAPSTPSETKNVLGTESKSPSFKVDKRALKVFHTLFFKPSASTQAGEVPWVDFLHAMISTGFSVEKLYGSVWHFQPSNLDVERSIQFHEPHPSSKIPFTMARRYGRRLNRTYGWEGSMFALAA
ncbi:hypothetical protein F5B20DRAFT_528684 [Whalleya microplaca]|nr:hypothetical protein F5B20DRAFT_528684 [Whalleya microplaca]